MGDRAWKAAPRRRPPTTTQVIVVVSSVCFLLSWMFFSSPVWGEYLTFTGLNARVWTMVTYPFVFGGNFIGLLFSMFWLWFMGAAVEARMGRGGFLGLYLGSAAVFALLAGLFASSTGRETALTGPYLPLAAVTVVWGALNPEEIIRIYCVIPIKGKWLAAITAGMVLFGYGLGMPLYGLVMVLPLAFLWLYAKNSIPGLAFATNPFMSRKVKQRENRQFNAFIDDVRTREKDREERERLRRLFESSLEDPDDKR